jgi:hypothetical protein
MSEESETFVDALAGDFFPLAEATSEEPNSETTPPGVRGRKRGRRRGSQSENQKPTSEVAKAGRMQCMRIVLDSLVKVPILSDAATVAGKHPKTLLRWLKRSAAGDAGYDLEWRGEIWRFHEHCESAIDEAHDRQLRVAWQIAFGVAFRIDRNGRLIEEACGRPNSKMLRYLMEYRWPEVYGKNRKIAVPENTGVLVVGGNAPKKPEYDTTASVRVRRWKALARKVRQAKL